MYERSAIVLERYFSTLLRYTSEFNLQDNFDNYCNLVQKLEKFQVNYQKEMEATQEFNKALKKVKSIQSAQEKLYKKSVNLEYNRNLLFNNIEGKIEDTRKGIEKVEADVEKNNEDMKTKKEELLEALVEYNKKRFELSKCKRYKKMAENDYVNILEASQINFEGITPEAIEVANEFAEFDNLEEVIEKLEDNGKGEKIPFNGEVIENATIFSVDIAKKLAAIYLVVYDKMKKILNDIEEGTTKVELHKKYVRNEKAKVDLLLAMKEYIVQFLDYERMTTIHGRKSHNRLMSEACENFKADVIQINNLYELLLREIGNKATKKAYKELYNKSYLIDIQEKEEKFKREKNRVNLNTATLINSNYWRIEGIKNIYTIFYSNVSEVFGKDVAEFDLPKEIDENSVEEYETTKNVVEEKTHKSKIPFEINSYEDEDADDDVEEKNEDDEEDTDYNNEEMQQEVDEDFDIFGDKYKEVDFYEVTKELVEKEKEKQEEKKNKKQSKKIDLFEEPEEEASLFEEDIPYEPEEEEEELFKSIKQVKKKKSNKIEDFDLTREEKSGAGNLIKKIKKINNSRKKSAESDIW